MPALSFGFWKKGFSKRSLFSRHHSLSSIPFLLVSSTMVNDPTVLGMTARVSLQKTALESPRTMSEYLSLQSTFSVSIIDSSSRYSRYSFSSVFSNGAQVDIKLSFVPQTLNQPTAFFGERAVNLKHLTDESNKKLTTFSDLFLIFFHPTVSRYVIITTLARI